MCGMTTTLSSFRRFLRALSAEVLPYTLKSGEPDPTGRACVLRHRMDSGLPDVVWWFAGMHQIEVWWRSLAVGWWARDAQLNAVAQRYRAASSDERELMATWQASSPEERRDHPWNAVLAQIEDCHSAETVTLPVAWRSWAAREYIRGANDFLSDDPVGDVIAACVAKEHVAVGTRSAKVRRMGAK